MKAAQDRQNKYVDIRTRPLEFSPGDKVFLKVAPWKHMLRFGMKRKLAPRYIKPFEILRCIRPVAYKINLPSQLAKVHNVFHVFLLRKANIDHVRVLPQVPVEVKEDVTLKVKPIRILDWVKRRFVIRKFLSLEFFGETPNLRKKHGKENLR
ncbi:hypothetical protein Peur_004642 [Populus x canadensis]